MGELLKDKVCLVTGSGQGIGRAIALAFAEEGAIVITNNRKPGSTRLVTMSEADYLNLSPEVKKEFDDLYAGITGDAETTTKTIIERGGRAMPIYCDISSMSDTEAMIKKITDTYGTIHIVINVAGAFGGGPLTEITEETWDKTLNIKPKGYFNVMKFALPHMVKQKWGRILNCTSRAMMGDIIKFAQYCAANAGSVGLTQAAACEYYGDGITVNAFGPWARTRAAYESDFRRANTDNKSAIPGMRAFTTSSVTPDPEAVPPFLIYLCTSDCDNITGTVFDVAGGEVAMRQYPLIERTIRKDSKEYWTLDELRDQVPRFLLRNNYRNILEVQ